MKPAFIDLGPFKGIQERTETHSACGDALKAMCTCYPQNPEYRQGCGHENECWVLGNARRANDARRRGQKPEIEAGATLDPESPTSHAIRRLTRAGVPSVLLVDARKSWPVKSSARVAAESWWVGDRGLQPALVLAGPTGVAKSTAAAWVSLAWAQQFSWEQPSGSRVVPFVWLDGAELQRIAGFDANAAMMLDAAETARLLVIDDAANESTAKAVATLSDVIRARCDHRRLTVLTTNVTGIEFRKRYGVPLSDRLRSCSVAPDLRGEKSLRGGE